MNNLQFSDVDIALDYQVNFAVVCIWGEQIVSR